MIENRRIKVVFTVKLKQVILTLGLVLATSTFLGCNSDNRIINESNLDMFNVNKGSDISRLYLTSILEGEFNKANSLCNYELINGNLDSGVGVSNIVAFNLESIVEGRDYGYYIFNVVRTSEVEPKSDLEKMTLKVSKEKDTYRISEIKSKSEKEVYVRGNSLRITGEDGNSSSLIINLSNLPKDTYTKENDIMLYKTVVPKDNFGKVTLSFSGEKVAIETTNNKDSYICIAYIDESVASFADDGSVTNILNNPDSIEQLQDILEKSVAKKVIPIDLLQNIKIIKMLFSEGEENLAVNYKSNFNTDRVKLYKADEGTLIKSNLDEVFPIEKYNVIGKAFDDKYFYIKVTPLDGANEIKEELLGDYKFNTESLQLNKL